MTRLRIWDPATRGTVRTRLKAIAKVVLGSRVGIRSRTFILDAPNAISLNSLSMRVYGFSGRVREVFLNGKPLKARFVRIGFLGSFMVFDGPIHLERENYFAVAQPPRIASVKVHPNGRFTKPKISNGQHKVGEPEDARLLATSFMLSSLNSDDESNYRGLFFGCYDLTNSCYRLPTWVWPSAIVAKSLMTVSESNNTAQSTANTLLRFQMKEGPNTGAFAVRMDVSNYMSRGSSHWLAPNDSAYIAAKIMAPMFRLTGEPVYLKSALEVGKWIRSEGYSSRGYLRHGYDIFTGKWEEGYHIVDMGFTGELFEELYTVTGDSIWKSELRRFLEQFLDLFDSGKGYLLTGIRTAGRPRRKFAFSRGQGWALEGLLAGWRILGEERIRSTINRVCELLVQRQLSSGAWAYDLVRPTTGEDNKGTPVIAYQLLRAYKEMQFSHQLRDAAVRAIAWCERNQYRGPDSQARGGIVAVNEEGAITGATNIRTAFPYASAYYLMASALAGGR
ncbi:MAG: hypothetical protein ACYC3W_11370 [Candidatus Nanopelagicales bacterium]